MGTMVPRTFLTLDIPIEQARMWHRKGCDIVHWHEIVPVDRYQRKGEMAYTCWIILLLAVSNEVHIA